MAPPSASDGGPVARAARWASSAVLAAMRRPEPVALRPLGAGYVAMEDYVVAVQPAGTPRMPNGIGCDVTPADGGPVWIGAGRLWAGAATIAPGPVWHARPRALATMGASVRVMPDPLALAGHGAGLTPYGDDVLAGYAAGLVLWHGDRRRAAAIAEAAAARTTLLSATLLRHAARGELPEPAHALLEHGDPAPLLAFGHSSGRGIVLGLALACDGGDERGRAVCVAVPPGLGGGEVSVWVTPPGAPAAGGGRTAPARR
jgi:hypothetical protein